ncbi:hypothetical protein [Sulfitobacter sp. SK012]|uniref:hypothetical protein n=1 Tax=Sulfitobacter sp. SK012 TaxID=1389005 RepID=UPI0013B4156E|nr:hypothetical protein [Sulfitobacter sp. SK012]
MTPLTRFFSDHLPARLVWPAVTMTYAAALLLLVLFGQPIGNEIIYIDLETAK